MKGPVIHGVSSHDQILDYRNRRFTDYHYKSVDGSYSDCRFNRSTFRLSKMLSMYSLGQI